MIQVRIYDAGEKYLDRFTILFMDTLECFTSNADPGLYWQYGTAKPGRHLGRRIAKRNLPKTVKQALSSHLGYGDYACLKSS